MSDSADIMARIRRDAVIRISADDVESCPQCGAIYEPFAYGSPSALDEVLEPGSYFVAGHTITHREGCPAITENRGTEE